MHPAPSVILFSVFSGLGFGILFWLGFSSATGWAAFWPFFFGYGFATTGLFAAAYHLANPKNAFKAFREWRSSWLSREAWLAVISLLLMAVHAIGAIFFATPLPLIGIVAGVLGLVTVFTTSMIYAQLGTVARWNQALTPVLFLTFALAGGALAMGSRSAWLLLLALAAVQLGHWVMGDRREGASTRNSATGLSGTVRPLFAAHSRPNYLMREMVYQIGRKHAVKLRMIAMIFGFALPIVALLLGSNLAIIAFATSLYLIGALASRWLFFAEARHSVALYY